MDIDFSKLENLYTDLIDQIAPDGSLMLIELKRDRTLREVVAHGNLAGMEPEQGNLIEWEERWSGDFIFENEWQSFRTKKVRSLERLGDLYAKLTGVARR